MKRAARPTLEREHALEREGYHLVAGMDEAGRGALAGPVVAAAVVLAPGFDLAGVRDSKLIPEPEREDLFESIIRRTVTWGVGIVNNDVIDSINILQATFVAMRKACAALPTTPDFVLIDGRDAVDVGRPCRAIIGGDGLSVSIAAASIIAKVTRDRMMRALHDDYPEYGFDRNKGYGTATHRTAILRYGPTVVHRRSFLGKLMQLSLTEIDEWGREG